MQVARGGPVRGCWSGCRFRHTGGKVRPGGQPRHVQNHGHAPIAQDGGAGVIVQAFQMTAERFHHDLDGVVQILHHQAILEGAGVHQDDVQRARPNLGARQAQGIRQIHQRHQPVAHVQHLGIAHPVDALRDLRGGNADQLADVDLRDGKALPAVGDQQ